MQIHKYESSEETINELKVPVIFLAGPTVRAHQRHLTSWRDEAIEEFKKQNFSGALIIPEFEDLTKSDKGEKHLPLWEFNGLSKADCILFWIPRTRELIGLTTNHEHGLWLGKDPKKVVYGRPDDAYRIDYLDIMWNKIAPDQKICNTLSDTVAQAILKSEKK